MALDMLFLSTACSLLYIVVPRSEATIDCVILADDCRKQQNVNLGCAGKEGPVPTNWPSTEKPVLCKNSSPFDYDSLAKPQRDWGSDLSCLAKCDTPHRYVGCVKVTTDKGEQWIPVTVDVPPPKYDNLQRGFNVKMHGEPSVLQKDSMCTGFLMRTQPTW